jgi:hypothetical protein
MASQARPKTRPGPLSEIARHVVLPEGIVSTGWPAVRDKCREFGDSFDEWQDGLGRAALAKRADGKYAATIDGVTLSIPRQVAKTFLVGRIVVALCVLFPGLTVLWTAHHGRTTTRTFRSLQGFVKRKRVWPHILGIRTANGEQEIAFRNGSLIMFGAREQGFGRGFEEVDIEVFDEAQILTEKALEDMVAATNQSRHPHGALLFYMGTPPRPGDHGEAFTAKRAKALAGKMRDGVYIECSADPDADPDDQAQWAKANPSFPHRTPLESMLRLRANLPSVEAWKREALGIWDSRDLSFVMAFSLCTDRGSVIVDQPRLAVSMSPDLTRVSLAASGRREDGLIHVEVVEDGVAGDWFVKRVAEVAKRQAARVWLHPGHPAGSLMADLGKAGVNVETINGTVYAQGCVAFHQSVMDGTLRHRGQDELDRAVMAAALKKSGDSSKWDGDGITALVAATQAAQAVRMAPVGGKGRAIALS